MKQEDVPLNSPSGCVILIVIAFMLWVHTQVYVWVKDVKKEVGELRKQMQAENPDGRSSSAP